VCFLDERIGLDATKPREVDAQLDLNLGSSRRRPNTNSGFDLGACRQRNVLAPCQEPHHSQKGSGVAGRKQLLGFGAAPVRTAGPLDHAAATRNVGEHHE
jgi:hypothetical protein